MAFGVSSDELHNVLKGIWQRLALGTASMEAPSHDFSTLCPGAVAGRPVSLYPTEAMIMLQPTLRKATGRQTCDLQDQAAHSQTLRLRSLDCLTCPSALDAC